MTTKQSVKGTKVAKTTNAKSVPKGDATRTSQANEQHKENAAPMPSDLLDAIYEVIKVAGEPPINGPSSVLLVHVHN